MAELRTGIRDLGDRAQELQKLVEHPGWKILEEGFLKAQEQYELRFAQKTFRGGLKAELLDQREIDYQRGFFRGVRAVLDEPGNAAKALEKALERENSG